MEGGGVGDGWEARTVAVLTVRAKGQREPAPGRGMSGVRHARTSNVSCDESACGGPVFALVRMHLHGAAVRTDQSLRRDPASQRMACRPYPPQPCSSPFAPLAPVEVGASGLRHARLEALSPRDGPGDEAQVTTRARVRGVGVQARRREGCGLGGVRRCTRWRHRGHERSAPEPEASSCDRTQASSAGGAIVRRR